MSNQELLDVLVGELDSDQRRSFMDDYHAITQLPSGRTRLPGFLDGYLGRLVSLYAATAGAIWFRTGGSEPLALKSRVGFDSTGLEDESFARAHRELLQFGITQRRPFGVQPFSSPSAEAPVSNPTDSYIILGPFASQGEPVGIVELFLGPTPVRGKTAGDRQRYVLWLEHLLQFLCGGIERRLLASSAPLPAAVSGLTAVRQEIQQHQKAIVHAIERQLQMFSGWNFGSLKDNQSFAREVHQLLESHGLRVQCPECGSPAILRCQNAGNSKTGVFLFDHYLDKGRTFHGGPTTVPELWIVPRPPRRKRSS